jgi:hypothetical protein
MEYRLKKRQMIKENGIFSTPYLFQGVVSFLSQIFTLFLKIFFKLLRLPCYALDLWLRAVHGPFAGSLARFALQIKEESSEQREGI